MASETDVMIGCLISSLVKTRLYFEKNTVNYSVHTLHSSYSEYKEK